MKKYFHWIIIPITIVIAGAVFAQDAPDIPVEPVTSNAEWAPIEQDFNGVTMVLVPSGCFMMGSTDEQLEFAYAMDGVPENWLDNEKPAHEICFDEPFWIDKTEVSNAQYGSVSEVESCVDRSSVDNQPRNCVTLTEAQSFCESRGARLPNEAEWEYAARGVDSWIFPWGDEFIGENVVYNANGCERGCGGTSPVGTKEEGASWVGALDMSGNVWEWTSSNRIDYPFDVSVSFDVDELVATRGGSYFSVSFYVRTSQRGWWYAADDQLMADIGFRCVRDYEPPANQESQETQLPAPTEPVTRNDDWSPVEQDFDGVTMVLVPAGCFMMGDDDNYANESPAHEQCIDTPFWIDKFEVTNAQLPQTRDEAQCQHSSEDDQPRICVSWIEANDFCASRNTRLPTEVEWEYTARGVDSLLYPWGNDFVPDYVVYMHNAEQRPAPVGSRPEGASWVGAMDMSGNLMEWTSSLFADYPYTPEVEQVIIDEDDWSISYIARNADFYYSHEDNLRASFRQGGPVFFYSYGTGFRCAMDYIPEP